LGRKYKWGLFFEEEKACYLTISLRLALGDDQKET